MFASSLDVHKKEIGTFTLFHCFQICLVSKNSYWLVEFLFFKTNQASVVIILTSPVDVRMVIIADNCVPIDDRVSVANQIAHRTHHVVNALYVQLES